MYELIYVIKGHSVSASTRNVPKQFILYSMHEVKRNNRFYNYDAINLYIGVESTAFGILMCFSCFSGLWRWFFFIGHATIIGPSTEIYPNPNDPIAMLRDAKISLIYFCINEISKKIHSIYGYPTYLHLWIEIIIMHHLSRIYPWMWPMRFGKWCDCFLFVEATQWNWCAKK